MDNTELNSTYVKGMTEEKGKIRGSFTYIKEYAKQVVSAAQKQFY